MYGNPTFRFTLTHAILGSLEISGPIGWKDAKLKFERHEDYHSLIEYFEGSFIFYGNNGVENGGLDFIKTVELAYGVDAQIDILIEISFDDGYTFETVFIGQLDISDIQETKNNKAEIPIIRNDFWANFINRRETPVNIQDPVDLDGNTRNIIDPVSINLTPQKIQQKSEFYAGFGFVYGKESSDDLGLNQYIQLDGDQAILDEIDEKYSIPFGYNTDVPVWIYEFEYEGNYVFDIKIETSFITDNVGVSFSQNSTFNFAGITYLRFYIQKNEESAIELSTIENNAGDKSTTYYYNGALEIKSGDTVRIYGLVVSNWPGGSDGVGRGFLLWGEFNNEVIVDDILSRSGPFNFGTPPSGRTIPTYFNIVAQTVYAESEGDAFLLHDAAGAITDRIIGRNDSFYSERLGSAQTNYRQYFSDGCDWRNVIIQGLQIRKYSLNEKQFSMSFKKWWDGANPILNLGLGYEIINDLETIRVEEKEYFFVPTPSLYIDNVYDIIREYDKNRIYKKVEIGYNKWQSEEVSGIDDPQTKHTYASRLQKIGTDFKMYSEFIAASLAIEVTRRQTIEKSKDYKFDNDVFIIAINGDDVSPDVYRPELNEDFNTITNLLNAETRYNLRLTPARNLLRWIKFLNNGLQSYVGSVYKFTAGEGNYDMTSDMVISTPGCEDDFDGAVLSEKQDIPVTDDYVFIPQEFSIEIDLSWDDYKTIRNNPRNAIAISQTTSNHKAFYIKSLEYELVRSRAMLKLWPVEPLQLAVVDFVPSLPVCESEDCMNPITTVLMEALTDAEGECITA